MIVPEAEVLEVRHIWRICQGDGALVADCVLAQVQVLRTGELRALCNSDTTTIFQEILVEKRLPDIGKEWRSKNARQGRVHDPGQAKEQLVESSQSGPCCNRLGNGVVNPPGSE